MIDDRIVLPLSKARESAAWNCRYTCLRQWYGRTASGPAGFRVTHRRHCLVPDIEERDALMAEWADYSDKVSPDCQVGGAKCQACTGCIHECHRPRRGASA